MVGRQLLDRTIQLPLLLDGLLAAEAYMLVVSMANACTQWLKPPGNLFHQVVVHPSLWPLVLRSCCSVMLIVKYYHLVVGSSHHPWPYSYYVLILAINPSLTFISRSQPLLDPSHKPLLTTIALDTILNSPLLSLVFRKMTGREAREKDSDLRCRWWNSTGLNRNHYSATWCDRPPAEL